PVTCRPEPSRCSAAVRPARPAPTTTMWRGSPATVRRGAGTADKGRYFTRAGAGMRICGSPIPGRRATAHVHEELAVLVDDRGGLQGLQAPAGQPADFLLEQVVRTGGEDEAAELVDLRAVGDAPQPLVEVAGALRIGFAQPLDGGADEHGALALPQVVARGFAGDGGVAEHAELVVAELEGDADVPAELTVRFDDVLA